MRRNWWVTEEIRTLGRVLSIRCGCRREQVHYPAASVILDVAKARGAA